FHEISNSPRVVIVAQSERSARQGRDRLFRDNGQRIYRSSFVPSRIRNVCNQKFLPSKSVVFSTEFSTVGHKSDLRSNRRDSIFGSVFIRERTDCFPKFGKEWLASSHLQLRGRNAFQRENLRSDDTEGQPHMGEAPL